MQFHHLRHMRLDEHDRLLGVNPRGQPIQGHFHRITLQILRGLNRGQGVDINDTIHAVIIFLQRNIILDRAQVIAQVLTASGACPEKRGLSSLSFSASRENG